MINFTALTKDEDICRADTTGTVKMKYLALGDSYTIGQSVEEFERWPVQLVDSLRKVLPNIADAEIIAQTGWTTDELFQGIESEKPKGPYDLVSLLIGVNNQYRHLDTGEYRKELIALLQMSIAYSENDPTRVIVVSIPDYGVTPFAQNMDPAKIAEEIDIFNGIIKNECLKRGVAFVDVTPISRMAADDITLLAEDGLHPSGKMYAEWVRLIVPLAYQIIKKTIPNEKGPV